MSLAEILKAHGVPQGRMGAGRASAPIQARYKRDLETEDLIQGATEGSGIGAQPIKAIRQSHHTVARLLAQGVENVEISNITGVSSAWISTLKADPAFEELLSYYTDMEAKGYEIARADMQVRLKAFGFDTMEELHSRLMEKPETFSNKELMMALELAADRTGHGKTQTVNQNVTHGISDETLARIRASSDAPAQLTEEDRRALVRLTVRATDVHPAGETSDWIEGTGKLVREEGGEGAEEDLGGSSPVSSVDPLLRQKGEGLGGA